MAEIKLEFNGAEVTATIKGDKLIFNRGGKRKSISLVQVLSNMTESRPDGVGPADWVELGALESRLMIHSEEDYCLKAKAVLFEVVRGMRNERREDRGLKPVGWRK